MDKILLEGIRLDIRVGTTKEERAEPQLCGLDLVMEANLKAAGRLGDLNRTVDYAAIFRLLEAHCSQNSFTLLEEIGQQLCDKIFDQYPVESIKLKIRKLNPFSSRVSAVGVELRRSRKRKKKRSR